MEENISALFDSRHALAAASWEWSQVTQRNHFLGTELLICRILSKSKWVLFVTWVLSLIEVLRWLVT